MTEPIGDTYTLQSTAILLDDEGEPVIEFALQQEPPDDDRTWHVYRYQLTRADLADITEQAVRASLSLFATPRRGDPDDPDSLDLAWESRR